MSQLRLSGVVWLDQVRAEVMESTGSVSVLAGDRPIGPERPAGVRLAGHVRGGSDASA